MTTEVTTNEQLYKLVEDYGHRYRLSQPFNLQDIHANGAFISLNRIKLGYALDDMVLCKRLVKVGESHYKVIDTRSDRERVLSLFNNPYVSISHVEIARDLKWREDKTKEMLQELVKAGVLEINPFNQSQYWIKTN